MKKVLCSAEKSSVIWAEPHSRSSAEQFGRSLGWGHIIPTQYYVPPSPVFADLATALNMENSKLQKETLKKRWKKTDYLTRINA